MKKGFSLIETLIALGLVGVVLTAINVLLFSTLRTAKKADAVGVAKSEGALALQGMTQMIRFAHLVDPTTCNTNSLRMWRFVKDANGITQDQDILYSLSGNQIASSSSFVSGGQQSLITSPQVVIARCATGTPIFSCAPVATGQPIRSVSICFDAITVSSTPTVDTAGGSGIARFQTQITIRNVDN